MAKTVALTAPAQEQAHHENALTRGKAFLAEVRSEMRKVSSPTRAEVQSTTTVVILAVFIFAAYFYVIDSVLGRALQALLQWLSGS